MTIAVSGTILVEIDGVPDASLGLNWAFKTETDEFGPNQISMVMPRIHEAIKNHFLNNYEIINAKLKSAETR